MTYKVIMSDGRCTPKPYPEAAYDALVAAVGHAEAKQILIGGPQAQGPYLGRNIQKESGPTTRTGYEISVTRDVRSLGVTFATYRGTPAILDLITPEREGVIKPIPVPHSQTRPVAKPKPKTALQIKFAKIAKSKNK